MTVPEGVEFHCECNTVPSKDVYDTITNTLSKRDLTKHDKRDIADIKGWIGPALVGIAAASATIVSGGGVLLAGVLAAMGGGVTWVLTKNDSPTATAEYMKFTERVRPIVKKLVTEVIEKGFLVTISKYKHIIGDNLSANEWKVMLTKQPRNTVSIVMVYAQVNGIIEHMSNAEEQNAVRHVLWQCLLKKRFGAEFATQLGDAHEEARPGKKADNKADEINNLKGQQLADEVLSDVQCFKRAPEMWEAGELQTRIELEANAMLTSKDPIAPIYIYDKPSTNASIIYDGKAGDKVAIVGYPDNKDEMILWCQIKFKEKQPRLPGWVLQEFIDFEEV
jgi:hypothetical protein